VRVDGIGGMAAGIRARRHEGNEAPGPFAHAIRWHSDHKIDITAVLRVRRADMSFTKKPVLRKVCKFALR
jgi:hypothetical protein